MGNTVRTVPCIGLEGGVGLGVPGRAALSRLPAIIKPA